MTQTDPPTEPTMEQMVREIHAFCFKLDQLLSKIENVLPMVLSQMPPDMARQLIG